MKKQLTLCLIHQRDKVLLGLKKRGFGAGRWNGFGGEVSVGETMDECVKREVFEGAGVEIKNPVKVGIIQALPLLNEKLRRRLPKCLDALKNNTAVYLEDGK